MIIKSTQESTTIILTDSTEESNYNNNNVDRSTKVNYHIQLTNQADNYHNNTITPKQPSYCNATPDFHLRHSGPLMYITACGCQREGVLVVPLVVYS